MITESVTAPSRWWRNPVARGGIALLVLHGAWRGRIAFESYYWQDDYYFLSRVRQHGLDPATIFERWNGHLLPGKYVLAGILLDGGTTFNLAAVMLIAASLVGGGLMLWVLLELFGPRPLILVGYAAMLFTPLGLVSTTWWSYGTEGLALQIALLGVLGSYLAYRRTGSIRYVVAAAITFSAMLFLWEKVLLAPLVTLGVAVLLLPRATSTVTELRRLVRDERAFWAPLAVVGISYGVWFAATMPSATASTGDLDVAGYLAAVIGDVLLPGLLGGPWTADGAVNTLFGVPSRMVVGMCAAFWIVLVVATVRVRRGAAMRAWAMAAGYLTFALLLVLWQRAGAANFLARDPRYVLDAVPVIVIAALAAMIPTLGSSAAPPPVMSRSVEDRLALPIVIALIASGWVSTGLLTPPLQHAGARTFVNGLSQALAHEPGASVIDAPAPPVEVVIQPLSTVTTAMGLTARLDEPSADLRIADGVGNLRPADIPRPDFTAQAEQGGCDWLVRADREPVSMRPGLTEPGLRIVRIGYLATLPTSLRVRIDGVTQTVATAGALGHVAVVTRGPVSEIEVTGVDVTRGVCVSDIQVGAPWPGAG